MTNGSVSDLSTRCQTGIASLLRQSAVLEERAAALADLLRELLPQAALSACLLRDEGRVSLAIRPDEPGSERERSLRSQFAALEPLAPRIQHLPAEALPGLHGLASAIQEDGQGWGFLVLALPAEAPSEDRSRAEAVLATAAPALALRWTLESLQRERTELTRFALVGQAFAGLAHDLNNALNSMMLQTSVVQLRVDPQVRQELAAIRQHGAQAAGLVRSLQHVVQERREQAVDIDLNNVLTELLREEADLRRRLVPRLGADAPRIHSTRGAAKQLVRLLLEGACAATKEAVSAETCVREDSTVLGLTIPGAADLNGDGGQVALETLLWQNLDEVGRQAGQSLLRQLGGAVTVEPGQNGALLLRVVWRQST